jgi:dihydrofolate reductase
MKITYVVAMNHDRVIGINNHLPWNIPEELVHFKSVTMGKPVIMGRKTFASIGTILPDRDNIVITHNTQDIYDQSSGLLICNSIKQALQQAQECAKKRSINEICIIGGSTIFQEFLPVVNRLIITIIDYHINLARAGEVVFFPEIYYQNWQLISSTKTMMLEKNSFKMVNCQFYDYQCYGQ